MNIEWDIEELAYRAMGLTDEEMEDAVNDKDIDEEIYNKYHTDFDTYTKIVKDLLPFTPLVGSPLTKTNYHAFVDIEQQRAIVKLDVDNNAN